MKCMGNIALMHSNTAQVQSSSARPPRFSYLFWNWQNATLSECLALKNYGCQCSLPRLPELITIGAFERLPVFGRFRCPVSAVSTPILQVHTTYFFPAFSRFTRVSLYHSRLLRIFSTFCTLLFFYQNSAQFLRSSRLETYFCKVSWKLAQTISRILVFYTISYYFRDFFQILMMIKLHKIQN